MSFTPKLLSAAVLFALAGTAAASPLSAAGAIGQIKMHGASFKAASGDSFVVTSSSTDADGSQHFHVNRTYNGLPMLGADAIVHTNGFGQFKGASLTLSTNARPSLHANISSDQAITEAGAKFGTGFTGMPTSRLVIYARGASPQLAHEVVFSGTKADQTPTEMHIFVNAKTGKVMDQYDAIETTGAAGTGNTLFSGTVTIQANSISTGYEMRDTTRGGGYTTDFKNGGTSKPGTGTIFTGTTNVWGNGSTSSRVTAGADAHYGVATTWDYYKNVHGRTGIAGDGKGAYSRVHVGRSYVNAFWSDSCFCMSYGDGDGVNYAPLVTLDIAGHEMSHGVTARSAGLVYSGESGGLNEATSDIMGTNVEYYANNANDPGDYRVGEKIYINGGGTKALRYMWSPNSDGGYLADCWYSGVGSLDVHYSSGPANHFYYILAEGTNGPNGVSPTCVAGNTKKATGNATVAGITRAKAEKVWYRALTTYMTSSTNYAGARTATINAATDLYGATSTEVAGVKAAWSAVGVN